MHKLRVCLTLGCFFFAMATLTSAQRTPGLWELTTTMTWQQSPFPNGAPSSSPHVSQFCVTQQYFDKYDAILPQIPNCQLSNLVKKSHGMTGEMVCTGTMSGKMNMESNWTDDKHATGSVHFVGTMKAGANQKPVEWTSHSTGVYKGADCGSVKPLPMPDK